MEKKKKHKFNGQNVLPIIKQKDEGLIVAIGRLE